MYARFVAATGVTGDDSVLDVGVTSDRSYASSNYLEAWYPRKDRITAAGIDDASFLERLYPGVRFVRANGLCAAVCGPLVRHRPFVRGARACRRRARIGSATFVNARGSRARPSSSPRRIAGFPSNSTRCCRSSTGCPGRCSARSCGERATRSLPRNRTSICCRGAILPTAPPAIDGFEFPHLERRACSDGQAISCSSAAANPCC